MWSSFCIGSGGFHKYGRLFNFACNSDMSKLVDVSRRVRESGRLYVVYNLSKVVEHDPSRD
jgi:hypothetical protein